MSSGPRFRIRAVADRLLPRRRGAHGAVQLGAGQAARRHVRAAHRGHRRGPQPAGVDAGDHRRARLDRHRRRRSGVRGPVLPERLRRAPTSPPPQRLFEAGARVLLRPDRASRSRRAPRRSGAAGLRRLLARPRPRARARPGAALPRARRRDDGRHDVVRGDVEFDNATIEDFVLLRGNGTPMFLLANVVDDIEMGITHVVRAEEHLPEHAQAAAAVGGARPRAAGVGARAGARQRAAQEAVEAARQGGARAVPRRGLPRRRDGQLPDDARLGAAGRRRDRAVVDDRARRSGSRTSTTRRRSSTSRSSTAFNGEYIRALSLDEFIAACEPFLHADGVPWPRRAVRRGRVRRDGAARADRVRHAWPRCRPWSTSCSWPIRCSTETAWAKAMSAPGATEVLLETIDAYAHMPDVGRATRLKATLEASVSSTG